VSTTTASRRLRPPLPEDREPLLKILSASRVFREAEIVIALEVFDAAAKPHQSDYLSLCAEVDGRLAGWICWGATPGTEGSFDLYWIVVDPALHDRGIGTTLLRAMEQRLPSDARLVRIETSGRPDYRSTGAFYLARGYQVAATLPDFYAPGDSQVIYLKKLGR